MHIIAVGLNFRTAPVEIREKLSFNEQELASAMKTLKWPKKYFGKHHCFNMQSYGNLCCC